MAPRKIDNSSNLGGNETPGSKALQAALQQIERSFGKGAIMRMGDKPDVKIESVSTGSLGLDIALGIGGVPKGRIMEVYGPESSGKCVTADTLLLSEEGLLSVEEFFEARGFKATNTTRIVPHEAKLINEKSEWESTSHLTWNGKRKVRRIETGIGSELGLTLRHPLRVLDDNGFIVWKNSEDINEGDIVPMMRGTHAYPSSDKITVDEASLLGYLVADGSNNTTNRVAFSNSDDEVVVDYRRIAESLFPQKEMVSYAKGGDSLTVDHHINSKEFRTQLYEKLGLEYHVAADKQVPACVRRSGKNVQLAFLRSYIELECSLDVAKRSVEISSASRTLLLQVQAMLLNMGVVSLLRPKQVDETMYWRLTASGEQGTALVRLLEFRTSVRQRSAELFAEETSGSTNVDSVPFMGRMLKSLYHWCTEKNSNLADMVCDYIGDIPRARLTYPKLRMIVDAFEKYHGVGSHPILIHFNDILESNYFYTSVESIKETVEPTFDVCMPVTHSFWSNGLISHNTTLALHILAEFQKQGAVCAFIDAEHALDPAYARRLGVDVDNLLLSQPDNGEQALEIVDTLVRSGGIGFIVVDSVAALTPRAEIEGEMGDSSVGVHARLMSQGMRKLTGNISRSNCSILFINQIRMKIGVMFGCFNYSSRVTMADGTSEKIGKLVNSRKPADVMSYDRRSGKIVSRPITDWFDNGNAPGFLQVTVAGGPSGKRRFGVTENHIVITPDGERDAGSLLPGDRVSTMRPDIVLQDGQRQLLLGGCIGDTSIRVVASGTASFRFGHGVNQLEYLAWKRSMLEEFVSKGWTRENGSAGFDVVASHTAYLMHSHLYTGASGRKNGRIVSQRHFEEMDARALAVWYMDDGNFSGSYKNSGNGKCSISTKSFDDDSRARACLFFGSVGIDVARIRNGSLEFDSLNTARLHALIAPYVHPSMDYKIHPSQRGCFTWEKDAREGNVFTKVLSSDIVLSVEQKPRTRSMRRFDISVDRNHLYFVDGVLVHNSPETTTGGNALKFYASVRMDIRSIGKIKEKDDIIGHTARVKVIKNKLAPPFRQAEFDIMYGKGISKSGELVDLGVKAGIIEKSGAWFSCDSQRIGQGRENSKSILETNTEMAASVEARIRGIDNITTVVELTASEAEEAHEGDEGDE